jgi:ComF family protein
MIVGPHEGVLKDSIWRLKYGPLKDISFPLANIIIEKYGDFLKEKRFAVTFTPTSAHRKTQRGYNQAEEMAKAVAEGTGLPFLVTMSRPHDVLHQVGLSRAERLENVVGTISYIGKENIERRKIVIIDDVYTTGATLEECAKVLRAAGYREVWGLVLSRD